jgi:formylglycine-generating enzyme required for sulfatase activity
MRIFRTLTTLLLAGALSPTHAQAPVHIDTVVVGNPGNAADSGDHGAVDHVFAIGKFEVTAGQYTAFLNAVAAADPEGLYHFRMDYDADPSREGCNIKRGGSPGSYTYSVAPDWADRPVNYVSWADAARFANWLHNGQPTGAQDLTTTEDGSYFLNGVSEFNDTALEDVLREPDATWVIPAEDEWYKAAYHKNDGATGNYWNVPTGADGGLSNQLVDPDPGNHATYSNQGYTIGAPYYRTEVGAHENSASPYGTFDQGGNVMEFTEAVPEPDIRRMRGGSWFYGSSELYAYAVDDVMHSSDQFNDLGFRVVSLAGTDVTKLRGFDAAATYFEWDPRPGGTGTVYDLARGDLANVSADAIAVDLGPLACIEDDSDDESSDTFRDTDTPAPGGVFIYVVRFQEGAVTGPWGFASGGKERAGAGCP